MKKVSVIMPVYNGSQYIKESIESILNQSYKNFEFIIVNEFGSDDGSKEIIENYTNLDDRIVFIQNKKREGIAESLNIALRHATGDYIARMDSDDIAGKRRLEVQVEFLEKNPSIGLCGIQPEFFGEKKIIWDLEKKPLQIKNNIFFYTPCVHPTIMFRRELQDKYNIFYNSDYKATEDYEFFSRVVNVTNITNIDDKSLFKYRMYNNNATNRNSNIGIKLYNEVMKNNFLKYLDIDFTDEEIKLLDSHISTGNSSGKELYDKVVALDLLLKKILLKTYNNKTFDTYTMFKTLRNRWQELRWSIPENNKTKAVEFFIDRSIFNYEDLESFIYKGKYKPDITILMPVYNSEKYILDSVLSILNQTYKDYQLLIMIEYNNNDLTEDYLKLLNDSRIQIVKNRKKLGLAATLNKGIKMAKTKYIARMDADDLSIKDRLEKQKKYLDEHKDIALVSAWQRHFGDFGTYVHKSATGVEDLKASLLFKCDICHSTIMFRRKTMIDNGYFYDTQMAMEDYDLWSRMIKKENLDCIPEILGEYRIHGENITQSKADKVIDSEINIISRNLERLHINKNSYDKRLLIGWKNIYRDNPKLIPQAESLFKKIIEKNKKYKIYNDLSLKKALDKRKKWILGIDESVEEEKYTSISKKGKLKLIIKKMLKPFVFPVYSRLMNRIENKINEKISDSNAEISNIKESIESINNSLNIIKHDLYDKVTKRIGATALTDYIPYEGGVIRIAILFQVSSFWPSIEGIYHLLKSDNRFELKFYLIDLPEKEPSQMMGAKKFLKQNKIDYEILTIDKITNYKPHVAIIQTPYDEWHRSKEFYSDSFTEMGIRLIYIPYGIEFSGTYESIDLQFNTNFVNNMWKIYTLSEITQKYYCIYSRLTTSEVKALGHPKFDGLFNNICTTNNNIKSIANGKKIILVKIHFAKKFNGAMVTPDSKVYVDLIDNLNKYKKSFFVFMLHPLMYDKNKNKESNIVVDKLEKCKNVYLFREEDYREPLYAADAYICDRSSVAIEMAALDKPVLYMSNEKNKELYIPEFKDLFDSYENGTDLEDIDKFIKEVEQGIDLNKEKRNNAFHNCVTLYDGNASKRIIDDIYNSILNEKV